RHRGRMTDSPESSGESWDAAFAADLIGKTLLIGLTRLDASGSVVEQLQLHGIVTEASPDVGITVICQGDSLGEKFRRPPELSAIVAAEPGSYQLKSTGEVVIDPDYTTSWTIQSPAS